MERHRHVQSEKQYVGCHQQKCTGQNPKSLEPSCLKVNLSGGWWEAFSSYYFVCDESGLFSVGSSLGQGHRLRSSGQTGRSALPRLTDDHESDPRDQKNDECRLRRTNAADYLFYGPCQRIFCQGTVLWRLGLVCILQNCRQNLERVVVVVVETGGVPVSTFDAQSKSA